VHRCGRDRRGFFIYLSNKRERILVFKFISDFLWMCNQLCLGGKEGWYAILPALGSMAAVIGFYSRRPTVTRSVSFLANGLWLAYDVIISNVTAALSGTILLLSALVGTARYLWQHRKKDA
jgi:hypothetical protein